MVWSKFKRDDSSKEDASKNVSVPNSLPGTLIDKKGPVKEDKKEVKEDKHLLPRELAEPAPVQSKPQKLELPQTPVEPQPAKELEEQPKPREPTSGNHSYFKQLEKTFSDDREISHKHFKDDIISRMKEYHNSKLKGEAYFFNEKDSDDHIYKHLLELKELEEEWSIRFKEYEAAKQLLLEKEKEIEEKVEVFKKVYVDGERFKLFNRQISQEVGFKLVNGHLLRSIQDLVDELKIMSDEVFNHHVNSERNDFENWIRHIFNVRDLADKVSKVSSKDELLKVLNE